MSFRDCGSLVRMQAKLRELVYQGNFRSKCQWRKGCSDTRRHRRGVAGRGWTVGSMAVCNAKEKNIGAKRGLVSRFAP
jgi:hypothetical protein